MTQTLDEIKRQLDSKQFFRANRQVIINFNCCTYYTTIEYSKLEVFTFPAFKERIVISQRKAKEFREWMDR